MFRQRFYRPISFPNSIPIHKPFPYPKRRPSYVPKYTPSRYQTANFNSWNQKAVSNHSSNLSPPPGFPKPIYRNPAQTLGFNIIDPERRMATLYKRKRALEEEQWKGTMKGYGVAGNSETGEGTSEVRTTIFLANVSSECSKEEVFKCCLVFGKVNKIMFQRKGLGQNSCYVFVRYDLNKEASIAVKRLSGTRRFGRSWKAIWARRELKGHSDEDAEGRDNVKDSDEIYGVADEEVMRGLKSSWMLISGNTKSRNGIIGILRQLGLQSAKTVRWGDYGYIVITSESQCQKWEENVNKLEEYFVLVKRLNPQLFSYRRYCWIECQGIPVQGWSSETMSNIAEKWGKILALDKGTDLFMRADVAKIFIETKEVKSINAWKRLRIDNQVHMIKVNEGVGCLDYELNTYQNSPLRRSKSGNESIQEVGGDDEVEDEVEKQNEEMEKACQLGKEKEREENDVNLDDEAEHDTFVSPLRTTQVFDFTPAGSSMATKVMETQREQLVTPVFVSKSNVRIQNLNSESPFNENCVRQEVGSCSEQTPCMCCIKYKKGKELVEKEDIIKRSKEVSGKEKGEASKSLTFQEDQNPKEDISPKKNRGRPKGVRKGKKSKSRKESKKKKKPVNTTRQHRPLPKEFYRRK